MRTGYLLILIVSVFLACEDNDSFPPALYDYQVERLLTGGEEKAWLMTRNVVDGNLLTPETCQDSITLVFKVIEADSITCHELRFDENCSLFDSTFYGAFHASGFENIFTDSLVFTGGTKRYMLLDQITSESFSVHYSQSGQTFQQSFAVAAFTGFLAYQVEILLAGGQEPGDSKTWLLSELVRDGQEVPLLTCTDSLRLQFEVLTSGDISAHQLVPTSDCSSLQDSVMGTVRASSDNGRFSGALLFTGSALDSMEVADISSSSFSASYELDAIDYEVTYIAE